MAPFEARLAGAKRLAAHPRLRVTDIERRLGTRYTADTIRRLKRRYPRVSFVWLMGADNLPSLVRWRRWSEIFHSVPVAIFDRHPYARFVRVAKPLQRFARYRVDERSAGDLAHRAPPAWLFVHSRLHPASATALRTTRGSGIGREE